MSINFTLQLFKTLFKEARNKTLKIKRRYLCPYIIVQLPFLTSQFYFTLILFTNSSNNCVLCYQDLHCYQHGSSPRLDNLTVLVYFCEFLAQKNISVKLSKFRFRGKDRFPGGGGGVLPYMGYIGMCGPKGYGFSGRFGHK